MKFILLNLKIRMQKTLVIVIVEHQSEAIKNRKTLLYTPFLLFMT